jgi:hypothetical protein
MDDDGNRSLSFEEFSKGIDESGVKVFDFFFFLIEERELIILFIFFALD